MEKLLALLQYGRVDPVPLITHRFQGLDQVETAFHLMAEKPPALVKTLVAHISRPGMGRNKKGSLTAWKVYFVVPSAPPR